MDMHKSSTAEGRKASAAKAYNRRLSAIQGHRKSSVQAEALEKAMAKDGVNIVHSEELNAADRRLAEMGYVQVHHTLLQTLQHLLRLTDRLPLWIGLQTRVLLAFLHLLRFLHLWTICKRVNDLRLPTRGRWCVGCRLVLVHLRLGVYGYYVVCL